MTRILLAAVVVFAALTAATTSAEKEKKVDSRVYEMRVYYAPAGKMKALHARFRDHTTRLFKKHGIEVVAFWSPTEAADAEKRLIYVLSYPSKEAADKSWKDFRADPEWLKAKADSEKEGTLVEKVESTYMKATDYSPMK